MNGDQRLTYAEMFQKLSYETAIVTFIKRDGSLRFMLCTRNLKTVAIRYGFQGNKLGAHDRRCSIKNGNVAVMDIMLGDSRSFSMDRLCETVFLGEITTEEELNKAIDQYTEYKEKCMNIIKSDDIFNNIESEEG